MSSGGPWSVKGIDPRARARAKSAARREGMTLGEWLNRVILDDGPDDDPDSPRWERSLEGFPGFSGGGGASRSGEDDGHLRAMVERLTDRIESAEQRSGAALTDVGRSVVELARRVENTEGAVDEVREAREALTRAEATSKALAGRVEKLEQENGPGGAPQALQAVETAFGKLARRLYHTETETGARLDETEAEARQIREAAERASRSLSSRLQALETKAQGLDHRVARSAGRERDTGQALFGLHGAVDRLRRRVETAERLTNDAARTLDESIARLESRLRSLETRPAFDGGLDMERRFDSLSDELAEIVARTRAEVARELETAVSEPRVERLEQAMAAAERRIAEADARHAEALSRTGTEVARLARALDARLRQVETRGLVAEAGGRAGRDLDQKLDSLRDENRAAVQKVGEEVARLGETLGERIGRAEQRSGELAAAAEKRVDEAVRRMETASKEQELEARLRQSERRTAEHIEKAMAGVHEKLNAARQETEAALSPVQRAMNALANRLEKIEQQAIEAAAPKSASRPHAAAVVEALDFDTPLSPPPEAETPAGFGANEAEGDPFLIAEDAAPAAGTPRTPDPWRSYYPETAASPAATRAEVRADMRADAATVNPPDNRRSKAAREPRLGATADADFLAAARNRSRHSANASYAAYESGESGGRGKTILIAASILGFLAIGSAAAMLFLDGMTGRQTARPAAIDTTVLTAPSPETVTEGASETVADTPAEPVGDAASESTADADPAPESTETAQESGEAPAVMPASAAAQEPGQSSVRAAVLTDAPRRAPTLEEAAAAGDPVARYQLGMARLQAGDTTAAAALLRRAAEQGVPAAQYRYSKLLETGAGVTADLEAARRWSEQAANAGHRQAMHNLGVMFAQGVGATQDYAQAADWFEQAALLGLPDSQFNLALLFEQGLGRPESAADAYAWYSIAAAGGDRAAAERAAAIARTLPEPVRAEAAAVATNFRPRPLNEEANGVYRNLRWGEPSPLDSLAIQRAQQLLAALGYDPGPADGATGPRTRDAILAFEADHDLARTGRIDAVMLDRLERAAAR